MWHLGVHKDVLPRQVGKHNALKDAKWVKEAHEFVLREYTPEAYKKTSS
jgi:hypothetical protein